MKRIILYLLTSISIASLFVSCKKMDAPYKEFLVPGGLIYPSKVTGTLGYAGRNRVKISWMKSMDPSIQKAVIFWNSYHDSVEVNTASYANGDTVDVIIDNLPEGTYSFFIRTYDDKGNVSLPVEVQVSAYGNDYQQRLLRRPINSSKLFQLKDSISIFWGAANKTAGAFASEVKYTDIFGKTVSKRFPVSDTVSGISGIDLGSGSLLQRTIYVPDSLSIDTFYTGFESYYFY